MHKIKLILVGAMFLLSSLLPSVVLAENSSSTSSSAGKQFTDESGAVWLVTDEGCRKAYTSFGAFQSFGFNDFKNITKGTAEDLAIPICSDKFILPREGSVIFSSNKEDYGTGYLITNGKKRGFVSYKVFQGLGFEGKKRNFADLSFVQNGDPISSSDESHAAGTLVNDDGTFKIITQEGAIGIPSADTLKSWGYDFKDAVPANNADKQKPESSVLTGRGRGQLNGRELIERCIARQLNSVESSSASGATNLPAASDSVTAKPLPSNCPPPPCLRVMEDQSQNQGMGASNILKPISCGVCEIDKSGSVESQTGKIPPSSGSSTPAPTGTQTGNRISPNHDAPMKKPGCLPPPCLFGGSGQSGTGTTQPQSMDGSKPKCLPPCPVLLQNSSNQQTQSTGTKDKLSCIPVPPPCPLNGTSNNTQTQQPATGTQSTGTNVLPKVCPPPCAVQSQSNSNQASGTIGNNSVMPCTMPPKCESQITVPPTNSNTSTETNVMPKPPVDCPTTSQTK